MSNDMKIRIALLDDDNTMVHCREVDWNVYCTVSVLIWRGEYYMFRGTQHNVRTARFVKILPPHTISDF